MTAAFPGRGARLAAGVLLVTAVLAGPARAQTIRPVTAEYKRRANGKVELVNESDRSMWVTLQVRGFTADERGVIHDTAPPAGIHVKLSAMSLQIPPRQSRFVFYDVAADTTPAWVMVSASFWSRIVRGGSGLSTQIELPHLIYVLPDGAPQASDIDARIVAVDRERRRVTLAITNRGRQFGRVMALETPDQHGKDALAGFALFPRSQHLVDLIWTGRDPVDVTIRTEQFVASRRLALPGG